jgi:hypothetical protein
MLNPAVNPEFQPHDVTGDGAPETFCNVFVRKLLLLLGLGIPAELANELHDWFLRGNGRALGWSEVTSWQAKVLADVGYPVVAVWKNPSGPHGHVALVVPTPAGKFGIHTAQAGVRCWSCEPIELAGLGAMSYSYFSHS